MNDGNLFIQLIAKINRVLSKTRIQEDITHLEKTPFYLRLTAALNKNKSRTKINQDLKEIGSNQTINVRARVDRNSLNEVRQSLQNQSVNINANITAPTDSLNEVNEAQEDIIESGKGIKGVVQSYVNWQRVLDLVIQAARKAVDTVKDLAKAQTDLQIVTGKSNAEMHHMMHNYNKLAQDLSATTTDVTSAADEWLRQGKTISETNELIQGSIVLSKVGQLEASESTQYLTSALNGYKLEASDTIKVVDRLSAVDLESATNAGGLAEAMSKCANGARIAGVSMDSLIGYIATVSDVTQKSASVVGESFKTMFSRMGKVKIGNFIDDDGTDMTEQINDVEAILSKFDIKLRDSADEFRNFEDVIYDVGVSFDKFTTVEKNAIAAGFGGVYQRENVLTLFENFDKVLKLTEVSANSAGKSLEKFAIYENGLEAATNRLTASFESLAYNTIDSEFMENLANATASIVEFTDKTKLIQTGLTALSFTAIIKGLLLLGTKMVAVKNNAVAMSNAMALSTMTTHRNAEQNILLGNSFSQLTISQQRLILSNKKLNAEQRIAILMSTGMTREMAEARLQTLGLATAEGAATSATFNLRGAWESLKLSIASNPLGLIITALTSATMLIQHNIQKQEELREEMKENAEQARETSAEIFDLYNQYSELSDAVLTDASNKEQLTSVTDELLKRLGYEKSAVQDLADEYGSLDDVINKLTLDTLKEAQSDLNVAVETYEDELKKTATSQNGIKEIGKTAHEAFKVLGKAGIIDRDAVYSNGGIFSLDLTSVSTIDDIFKAYEKLQKAQSALNNAVEQGVFTQEELRDTKLYQGIVAQSNELKIAIGNYNTAFTDFNANIAQQKIIESLLGKELPKTKKEFNDFKETLIETAVSSNSFIGSEEDIVDAVESVLSTMPEFVDFFDVTSDTINGSAIPSLTNLASKITKAQDAMEDFMGVARRFGQAIGKAISGAALSTEEMLELLKLAPELASKFEKVGVDEWSAPSDVLLQSATEYGNANNPYNTDYQNSLNTVEQLRKTIAQQEQEAVDLMEAIRLIDSVHNEDTAKRFYYLQNSLSANQKNLEVNKTNLETEEKALEVLKKQKSIYGDLVESGTYSSQFQNVEDKVTEHNNNLEALQKAIDNMADGTAISSDEMIKLVNAFPELKDKYTVVAGGFNVETKALEELKTATIGERKKFIQIQRDMVNAAREEQQLLVKIYDGEIKLMKALPWLYSNSESRLKEYEGKLQKASALLKMFNKELAEYDVWENSLFDSESSGSNNISNALQSQIDYYSTLIEAIEIVADRRIELLEKEKDALKEKNDEEQRELDLIEAKNNLDKARKQTVFVYEEGKGLVQKENTKAIRDAEKELADVEREIKTAEYDKLIETLEDYKEPFSNLESDIKDNLTVEKAKNALDTDEAGLLHLDEKVAESIQKGLAGAVLAKDREDNKDNPYYGKFKTVTLDDVLKSMGATVSSVEFKSMMADLTPNIPVNPYKVDGTAHTDYVVNNNGTTTFNATFNITGTANPNEVADIVKQNISGLIKDMYNKEK